MNVEVMNRQRKYRVDRNVIKKIAGKVLSMCRADDSELSILIVNNSAIRNLNRKYRGIDKPTDVLAFPMGGESGMLGDIVISMEKTHAQAVERGHSPGEEFRILLIHGILHLLGYDHEVSQPEARRMKRKEKAILSKL